MRAHQKIIKDRGWDDIDLLGAWWENIDVDIKKAVVKPVSRGLAEEIIKKYEWLGCMSAINWFYFGIFFDGYCGGVVCYGPEYSENLGKISRETGRAGADWSKYGYEGKMILLNRGACVHWAHPHSASKLIRASMRMLPDQFKVVTATVDDLAGEVGTIYQACGFDYVGSMRDGNDNVKSKKGDRDGWVINGKLYGSRAMRAKFGTTAIDEIKKHYPSVKKVKQNSKGRYFGFVGNKREIKQNRAAIADMIKPYPKRQNNDQPATVTDGYIR
jgi:hypothetical protein